MTLIRPVIDEGLAAEVKTWADTYSKEVGLRHQLQRRGEDPDPPRLSNESPSREMASIDENDS